MTDFLVGDAVLDRAQWRPGDAYLAGGTWLFSEPQPGLTRLRDLTTLRWPALSVDAKGLEIAATCTLAELVAFTPPTDWAAAALFGICCDAVLGSFKVQHVATVGGNICLALAAAPMVSLAAGLDGVATLWAPDGTVRTVAVAALVVGNHRTALRPGELLRSVRLPLSALRARPAFRRFSLSTGGRSAGVIIGRVDPDDTAVFTVTAATVAPLQLRFSGLPTATVLAQALTDAGPRWHDDVHGDPRWRAALTARYLAEVRAELAGPAA